MHFKDLADKDTLRRPVTIPSSATISSEATSNRSERSQRSPFLDHRSPFLDHHLRDEEEYSHHILERDEVHAFLTFTAHGDRCIDQLVWWRNNCALFPNLLKYEISQKKIACVGC